ncbi:MAG: LysM peptidoglycan-binding domain-containing protein [Deltaproteobacteria bacterium]|nr:LysM peptidoglycan-binding domain-containing protein [Deltaproteobacteria bacterium]
MTRQTKLYPVLAISAAVLLCAAGARAQDVQYEKDIKPGLHLHANSSEGSLLSEAARDGKSVVISESGGRTKYAGVETYVVKEGDTLWDICTKFFGDPYHWPRIWSYNQRITNPHWIYPGDVVWLVPPRDQSMPASASAPKIVRRSPSTVLIRNRGFIDKEALRKAGTLVGSQKEIMMLSQFDEAYVEFPEEGEVNQGDEFAAFKVVGPVDGIDDPDSEVGKLVEILGVVRVISYNPEKKVARVVVDESMRPIERGTMIGPVHRRFSLVPPVINDRELSGYIIAFLDPVILAATHQVVFVDKGETHGVKEGNRFFVIEKRDRWRKGREEPDDHEGYPFEVLAEMRVIETRPKSSTCLVTASVMELSVGAEVEMVEGY